MKELLNSIRDIAFVVAVFSYFAGWVYIYFYLVYFGLSIGQVGADFYYFLIYSYNVLTYHLNHWPWLIVWVIAMIVLAVLSKVMTTRPILTSFFKGLVLVALVVLFPLLYTLARKAAWHDAAQDANPSTSSLKKIKLVFTEDFLKDAGAGRDSNGRAGANAATPAPPASNIEKAALIALNESEELRLLMSSSDEYFLLYKDSLSLPLVYVLPKTQVQFIKLHVN